MRYAKILTRAQLGLSTHLITIEVHISPGLPALSIVGLPETAIKESRDRVRSAILNSGFDFPRRRVTINLAPADLPKREGGRFDLPIALGILIATGQVNWPRVEEFEFAGELGLDGGLRRFNGAAIMALASKQDRHILVVPAENYVEIQLVSELRYIAASSLADLCRQFIKAASLEEQGSDPCHMICITDKQPLLAEHVAHNDNEHDINLSDIYGQQEAKRVLEIAAAGGHSLFVMGPPGVGKSMLAHRLITILPPLTYVEALENLMIHSLYHGYDSIKNIGQATRRPFRAPHHSISTAALVGGSNPPVPGEISLANHGVLFLDELLEFSRKTLEALREPLESKQVIISRAAHYAIFPCDFQLIVAMNPCPCGYYGDKHHACSCSHEQIRNYRSRVSGPLLDRIDLWLWMPSLGADLAQVYQQRLGGGGQTDLSGDQTKEDHYESSAVRQRVIAARKLAMKRAKRLNSTLSNQELEANLQLDDVAKKYLQHMLEGGTISARSYHRILKVARTIADLADSGSVRLEHLQEAFSYRRKSGFTNESCS